MEAIRARHDDFAARYSPGPDWEPFNQTHQDRAYLLGLVDDLAGAATWVRERARCEYLGFPPGESASTCDCWACQAHRLARAALARLEG